MLHRWMKGSTVCCRARKRSFPERSADGGAARLLAALVLGLQLLLDAVLAAIATPVVRAEWRHHLSGRGSRRPTDSIAGGRQDWCVDAGEQVRVVHHGKQDSHPLRFAGRFSSDHAIEDGSGHGGA